ncbi:hypothetical protein FGK63_03945 [Ruegeria sediminis]|uniref:DUF805 domain-containing protein n=1 Tax=Ruegeria sediminis TaxID=2583820 RepID=A0ABY2X5H7_9RHOB|nr:hypothetical protein [Ruegeria sediminis]TMV10224.1 hypothetical protein FGK63_03945 [Ruegeria sediminis]
MQEKALYRQQKMNSSFATYYGIFAIFFIGMLVTYLFSDMTFHRKGAMAHLLVPFFVMALPLILAVRWGSKDPNGKVALLVSLSLTLIVLTAIWFWCLSWFIERRISTPGSPVPDGPETTRFINTMFGWTIIFATATVPKWSKLLPRHAEKTQETSTEEAGRTSAKN